MAKRTSRIKTIRTPADVYKLLRPELDGLEQEQMWVIAIDIRHNILGCEMIAKGTAHSVEAHPRDVFRFAVRNNAAGLLIAHNHPSGDPEPSTDDLNFTKRMRAVGVLLSIPVVDHVVLTLKGWCSIATRLEKLDKKESSAAEDTGLPDKPTQDRPPQPA